MPLTVCGSVFGDKSKSFPKFYFYVELGSREKEMILRRNKRQTFVESCFDVENRRVLSGNAKQTLDVDTYKQKLDSERLGEGE